MARTEHTINDALAKLLRGTRRAWRDDQVVTSEDTGQLKDTSGRPDILVIEPRVRGGLRPWDYPHAVVCPTCRREDGRTIVSFPR